MTGEIASMAFFMNCSPGSSTDPLSGNFDVEYRNNGEMSGTATVTSAKLALQMDSLSAETTFLVAPDMSDDVDPGAKVTVKHDKVYRSGVGGGGCGFCSGKGTLSVTWTDGSNAFSDSFGPQVISCAF